MAREFIMPGHIVSGEHALNEAKSYLKDMGKKALLVTDEVMVQLGNVAAVEEALREAGVEYAVYSGISGEPTDQMIYKGLEMYRQENCDFLIALGGGSPIDSMKAIGAMSVNEGKISDYMGKTFEKKNPPMAAIPTTAGTGSEATQFTIITDTENDVKMLLKGGVLMPDLAIIDPRFTMTAPPKITAATGLDALTHAIEAYTSKRAQSLSDTFAVSAVRKIFRYLPRAFKDGSDVKARDRMAVAALEAGIAFNNSSVTIVHGMSRPIGALFHVPHGMSNAMLLKECFGFVMEGADDELYERFAYLGRTVHAADKRDSDQEASRKFLEAVVDLCRMLEIPTLEEYGINKEEFFSQIDKMAEDAMASGSPSNTRKQLDAEDLKEIYRKLWE